MTRTINIDPLSVVSLRVELAARGQSLSTATGFVVERHGKFWLVTNWHVLAGRNPETSSLLSTTGATPDEIHIVHHGQQLGSWKVKSQPLVDANGDALWIEHPSGREVDLGALELEFADSEIKPYPLDLGLAAHDARLGPATAVSIIGYPYGLATGKAFPIWKTGHIASDPDVDYDGKPAFLIDATTRGGMSGSPVVFRSGGGYLSTGGAFVVGKSVTSLLGVYSGRIHQDAGVGRMWRPYLVEELLDANN